jgi:hypothetical protein
MHKRHNDGVGQSQLVIAYNPDFFLVSSGPIVAVENQRELFKGISPSFVSIRHTRSTNVRRASHFWESKQY